MTFLQEKTAVLQIKYGLMIITALPLLLIPFFIIPLQVEAVLVLLGFTLISGILLLCELKSPKNWVTIDDSGLRCHRRREELWTYTWDDIIELKPANCYNSPGVEIVTSRSPVICGCRFPSGHCFQLCKEAKLALAKYCPPEKRKNLRRIRR